MSEMNSEFWGLILVPGKKFTPEEPMPIRVTQICFGEKVAKGSRTCVFIRKEGREYALCTLLEGKKETLTVDIRFPDDDEFSLFVSGPNEVHLTGEVLPPSLESDDESDYLSQLYENGEFDDEEDDEEIDSDESLLEPANIEEISPVVEKKKNQKNSTVNGNSDKKRKGGSDNAQASEPSKKKVNGNADKPVTESKPQTNVVTEAATDGEPATKLTKAQRKRLRKKRAGNA